MDIDDKIVASLSKGNDADLRTLVQQNMSLSRAILANMPALAEDAGYEPFSKDWVNRYWRNLLIEVSGKPVDKLFDWALKASAATVATQLVQRFGLDVAAYSAAIALAILLLRAAAAANDKKKPSTATEKDQSTSGK
jgi:hypothetical protein